MFATNRLEALELDERGRLIEAAWARTEPDWDTSSTLYYSCAHCGVKLPEEYQLALDRVLGNGRDDRSPRFRYLFDAYVYIEANTKHEAVQQCQFIEQVIGAIEGASMLVTDAYGIEEIATGDEIRPVG